MILELKNICREFCATAQSPVTPVLRGVNLSVAAGASLAITGPSGSGKSTLLNLIAGLDKPTQGQVLFEGQDLAGWTQEQLAEYRRRKVGLVFQLHHLLPQLSALENVLLPTLATPDRRAASSNLVDRARQLLTRVGLAQRESYRPGQLSGGERQRVAVARALIMQPALLLADEPTGSLDQQTAGDLIDLLLQLNREQGVTLILVTHAPELAQRMSRVHRLRNGCLLDPTLTAEDHR